MVTDKVHAFYTSKAWRELSYKLKVERGFRCERSGELLTTASELIAHHTVELTEANVHDPNISLNPNLIEVISFEEHNKEHRRFSDTAQQHVYIVYGPPLGGKTGVVREMMRPGDIALDMDELWQALTLTAYIKPDAVRYNVFKVRNEIIDEIRTRYGNWIDAYVIGGYPRKLERNRLAQQLNAELIYIATPRNECHSRCVAECRPRAWHEYIDNWFDEFEAEDAPRQW